ncbi:SDR family oxidoreductase [soil metagenome]
MKIAITGSTGHIAASLIPLLIQCNNSVRALIYEQQPAFDNTAIEFVKGSITVPTSLNELVTGCDVVIHCAARISINSNEDNSVYDTNVTGTKNVFNAAKQAGVKRFLYVSSIHAYDQRHPGKLLNEESNYCSGNAPAYDRSKRDAEQFVLQHASADMEVVVLNPTGIVGPPDHRISLMGQAIINIYNKKVPALIKGGFDFCDVRDVSNGIMQAIDKGRNGQAYFLSGKWTSIADLHTMLMNIKIDKSFVPVLPIWIAYAGLPFINLIGRIKKQQPLYTKESLHALMYGSKQVSNEKAAKELGYSCRPILETITDAISWYKMEGKLE